MLTGTNHTCTAQYRQVCTRIDLCTYVSTCDLECSKYANAVCIYEAGLVYMTVQRIRLYSIPASFQWMNKSSVCQPPTQSLPAILEYGRRA